MKQLSLFSSAVDGGLAPSVEAESEGSPCLNSSDNLSGAGILLRDQALKKVGDNNENWMEACVLTFVRCFRCGTFTGEDIRFTCSKEVGLPKHSNAWGALVNTLIKRGLIEGTGLFKPMKDSRSHARITPVYRRKL